MFRTLENHVNECNRHGQPTAYWGESDEWIQVLAVHRDSDSLSRSNFAVLLKRMGGESDTVRVERFSHWAVGWIDYLLVSPADAEWLRVANEAREAMEDYPVLDETHWSELEWNEFWTFAESELEQFDGWEAALSDAMEKSNSGPGDESAEWKIIDAARDALEAVKS